MLTKYILTIGSRSYDVPDECLANWDDISFSLRRTDYSGVMRSYSTEFVFVGVIRERLLSEYLVNGFKSSASIAAYTLTNTHEWEKQHEAELDFSTVEDEGGKLTMNAIDNTLAAKLKSKKGQKYEFLVSEFGAIPVTIQRMAFANSAKYRLPNTAMSAGIVDARLDEGGSSVISTDYIEPKDESSGYDGTAVNRFFAMVNLPGVDLRVFVTGMVRCWLNNSYHMDLDPSGSNNVAHMELGYYDEDLTRYVSWSRLFDNDITHKRFHGINKEMWIGRINHTNYLTLDALKTAAASHAYGLEPGMFGVVGSSSWPNEAYWTDNVIYEYSGFGRWVNKGMPGMYYQDRNVSGSATLPHLATTHYPMLWLDYDMELTGGVMSITWTDPARQSYAYNGIRPIELLRAIVAGISPGSSVSIAEDENGRLANTLFFPAEALRKMAGAKVYSTFQQFCDWMGAVFGYTYRIVGNEVQFVHRSAVFSSENVKDIENVRDVKYSVNDSIIYSEVDAGYSKKEYGEINGRLETNFTNYYSTGYSSTDKKLSLISKYRSDAYGIEFTLRKGEKQSDTTDDKNDEDVFFAFVVDKNGSMDYTPENNAVFSPESCVLRNAGYIAAMGNGAAVTLEMTSSDGNNALDDVLIPEGAALFTAGELEFTTDDMDVPEDMNGLVSLTDGGFSYTGFILEAKCRYGRRNGMDYTLIVKTITKI